MEHASSSISWRPLSSKVSAICKAYTQEEKKSGKCDAAAYTNTFSFSFFLERRLNSTKRSIGCTIQ